MITFTCNTRNIPPFLHCGLPQYLYTCIFNFTIQSVYSSQARGGCSITLIIPRTYATARKGLYFLPHDYPKHHQYRIEKCVWIGLSNECLSQQSDRLEIEQIVTLKVHIPALTCLSIMIHCTVTAALLMYSAVSLLLCYKLSHNEQWTTNLSYFHISCKSPNLVLSRKQYSKSQHSLVKYLDCTFLQKQE